MSHPRTITLLIGGSAIAFMLLMIAVSSLSPASRAPLAAPNPFVVQPKCYTFESGLRDGLDFPPIVVNGVPFICLQLHGRIDCFSMKECN